MENRPEDMFQRYRSAVAYGMIKNLMYPEHIHKGYEMICVLSGSVLVYTPERVLRAKPGQMVFIGEEVLHGYLAQRDAKTLMLGYRPRGSEGFVPLLSSRRHAVLCLEQDQQPVLMRELCAALTRLPEEQQNLVTVTGYIHFLLSSIAQYADRQPLLPVQELGPFERAIQVICGKSPVVDDVGAVAREAGLSKYYFSRLFGQRMGMSYNTYAALLRIDAARRMMVQTQLSIEQVLARCGYTSQRSFNRQFAAIVGQTPRQYRRENQDSPFFDYECPFLRELLENRETWRVTEPAAPAIVRRCGAEF